VQGPQNEHDDGLENGTLKRTEESIMPLASTIDMDKFCGTASSFYLFDRPFVINGYKYATDGSIAIRVPTDEPDTKADTPFPPVDNLPWPIQDGGDDWPDINRLPGSVTCEACDGEGEHDVETCSFCEDGIVECSKCGAHSECEVCCGCDVITEPCTHCDDGKITGPYRQDIYSNIIESKYDDLIRTLPNPKYFGISSPKGGMLKFTFDGGAGIVIAKQD